MSRHQFILLFCLKIQAFPPALLVGKLSNYIKKSYKRNNDKSQNTTNESNDAMTLFKPINGTIRPLKEIGDPVFSEGYMGKGCGIVPMDDIVYSPVKGKIAGVFPTKHAITMVSESGMEILIHLGIDTVRLQGEPFEMYVEENQEVYIGTPLVKMNNSILKEKGYDNTVIVVITNTPNYKDVIMEESEELIAGSRLLHVVQ